MRDVVEDFLVNKTIFFVGDSINGLVYQAAVCISCPCALSVAPLTRHPAQLCEMSRWGLQLSAHHPHDSDDGVAPDLLARLKAYYRRVARYHQLDEATGKGFWLGGEPPKPEVVASTATLVVPKGWHRYKPSDMVAILSLADVVIVNYALHYHGPPGHPERMLDEYEQEMHALFLQLDAFARLPGKAAIFRETGAQHFAGTGSYAGDEQAHPEIAKGCHCAPMSDEVRRHNEVTRYNDIVHDLASRHPHVRVLPFYVITAPRHDMHEGAYCAFDQMRDEPDAQYVCCDCTHFCHTPQLWRHVFAALYDVLETTRVRDTPTTDFDLP